MEFVLSAAAEDAYDRLIFPVAGARDARGADGQANEGAIGILP